MRQPSEPVVTRAHLDTGLKLLIQGVFLAQKRTVKVGNTCSCVKKGIHDIGRALQTDRSRDLKAQSQGLAGYKHGMDDWYSSMVQQGMCRLTGTREKHRQVEEPKAKQVCSIRTEISGQGKEPLTSPSVCSNMLWDLPVSKHYNQRTGKVILKLCCTNTFQQL